jgi:hypothetical protein
MKDIYKILIGILLIVLLLNCLTTEGWVDAPPLPAAPYDLSVSQDVLITDIPAPTGTTAALVTEYTASAAGSAPVQKDNTTFTTDTGLSIDATTGVISGTTGASATVDGVFKVDFTGATPVSKYIKIKIATGNTDNIQPGNLPVIGGGGGGGGGGSTTCEDGSAAQPTNPCDDPSKMSDIVGAGGESPTAENACTAIETRKAEIAAKVEEARLNAQINPSFYGAVSQMWDNTTGSGEIMNSLISAAGGDQESKQFMATVMNIDASVIQMSDHEAACSNSVGGLNLNEIVVDAHNADCQTRMIDALGADTWAGLVSTGALDPTIDVSNVDQTIQNKNNATCIMDSMIQAHSDQMTSVDNVALQESMQDMTGGGQVQSDMSKCTEINTNNSVCEYIKDKQCCMNSVTESRENLLSVGDCFSHVHDINQLIDTENNLTCASSDYEFQDTVQTTNVIDEEGQTNKQTTTPNYMMYVVIALIAIAVLVGLYFGAKFLFNKSPAGMAAAAVQPSAPQPSAPPAAELVAAGLKHRSA